MNCINFYICYKWLKKFLINNGLQDYQYIHQTYSHFILIQIHFYQINILQCIKINVNIYITL